MQPAEPALPFLPLAFFVAAQDPKSRHLRKELARASAIHPILLQRRLHAAQLRRKKGGRSRAAANLEYPRAGADGRADSAGREVRMRRRLSVRPICACKSAPSCP